jgi:rubredoxin
MYKKGTVVEIQFAANRLNDGAGEPYWIDLDVVEATRLYRLLGARLGEATPQAQPLVIAFDGESRPDVVPQAHARPAAACAEAVQGTQFRQWVCVICGWIYDEAEGVPDEGIARGTRWADVPADWRCPLCDVGKEDFAMVEF